MPRHAKITQKVAQRHHHRIDPKAAARAIRGIQVVLWCDPGGVWNPEKEWDASTIEGVAEILRMTGLGEASLGILG